MYRWNRFLLYALPALCLAACPIRAFSQSTAADWLAEAARLFRTGDLTGDRKALEKAIEVAATEQNRQIEADAHSYLGELLARGADYAASRAQFEMALRLYEESGNRSRAASVKTFLATNAFSQGDNKRAKTLFEEAMALYESLNDQSAAARMHYNLAFVGTADENKAHIERGLELARQSGSRITEGLLLHLWADLDYASDDFRSAFDRLDHARTIFEELGDKESLARVLTSIGRLYRVHGHADLAIPFYQQALDLQKQAGDKQGVIQSLNAIATALNNLGRGLDALDREEEALKLARETGSSLLIKFAIEGVANCLDSLKRFEKAAELLEEARQLSPPRSNTLRLLADVRFSLGQYAASLKAAEDGLELERNRDILFESARALWKLGRTAEALDDVREVLGSIEQARATLVPTDFMKQGFSDTSRNVTNLAISLFLESGQENQALATAEQSRSRAFLDLLASKNLAAKVTPLMEMAANDTSSREGVKSDMKLPPPLLTRGGTASDARPPRVQPISELPSLTAAPAASTEDVLELAARLNSTILEYWVQPDSTIIWTISADGKVATTRIRYGEETLSRWIDEALHQSRQEATRGPQPIELASRAGDTVLASRSTQAAWRRLYDALIRPIRPNLPIKGARRLTIIPNGPLFRISFAALLSENGRYLIEDYAIHYAPAAGVLNYTNQTKKRTSGLPASYMLVANPSGMPSTAEGKTLPRLPGADEEVRRISQLLPQGTVTTLRGGSADEPAVRKAMMSAKVIHLATHGIIDDNDPLGSFLALGRVSDLASADGRLTAAEVYDLDLHADLVVLSACRTGLGRISGDGVAGLARAFFYAGAASVVSTLWDVADGPASQLIGAFYQSLNRTNNQDKLEALRAAQLSLLHSLRSGEVRVETPFGKLALPEDPVLWAGFVLMGEP